MAFEQFTQASGQLGMGVGEIMNAWDGPPKYNVLSLVKSKPLQSYIDQGLGDYGNLLRSSQAGLRDFTNQFNAGNPQARQFTGQELGNIGQFYNGGMAGQLAGLRATRQAATNAAADLAAQQAMRGINRSQVGNQGGGGGSYADRLRLGAVTPIRIGAALDAANQARGDLQYLTGNQLGLTGQRTGLINALAQRGLVPTQMGQQLMGSNLGLLTNLQNLNNANMFYGVQRQPTLGDRVEATAQGVQTFNSGVGNIAGGVMGMMGGGMGGMMGGGGGGGGGMGGLGGMMGGGGGGGGGGMGGGQATGPDITQQAPFQEYSTPSFGSNNGPTPYYGGGMGAGGWGYGGGFAPAGGGGFSPGMQMGNYGY